MKRQEIVDEARKYLEVRWGHQGRLPKLDCAGLVRVVGDAFDVPDYDETNYSRVATDAALIETLDRVLVRKNLRDARVGDVIVFRETLRPCHLAILTHKRGALHIIHSSAGRRGVFEEPYDHDWPKLATHCFEFPGVED